MLLHRLTTEEPDDPLQLSEESQEYDGCTIVSDCIGYEESLVSREQVSNLDDVITLDSDDDSVEQLDCSGTRPDDEYVEPTHTDEQPSIDDQSTESSSGSLEVQLAAVGSGDFGNIVQHKIHLNDHQKLNLLKKHFVPASDYKFPTRVINGIQRHFQHSWLSRYPGLVYSKSQDGGYCKYCVLFGKHVAGSYSYSVYLCYCNV